MVDREWQRVPKGERAIRTLMYLADRQAEREAHEEQQQRQLAAQAEAEVKRNLSRMPSE